MNSHEGINAMKTHMEDIRLANNAGMSFPVCHRNPKITNNNPNGYLDLDKSYYSITGDKTKVSCKHCIRLFKIYYPWAAK